MTRYRVVVEPEAQADLEAIEIYIAGEGNPEAGEHFVAEALALCRTLNRFPYRGSPRDDLREGLRSLTFRRRAVIMYMVIGDKVSILGVAYGGRDLESLVAERRAGAS